MAIQYLYPSGIPNDGSVGTPSIYSIVKTPFKIQLDMDIDEVFLNVNEFSDTYQYTYKDGSSHSIHGIFDKETSEISMGSEIPGLLEEPMLTIGTEQFKGVPGKGDSVVIENTVYKIKKVSPDGTGVTTLTFLKN